MGNREPSATHSTGAFGRGRRGDRNRDVSAESGALPAGNDHMRWRDSIAQSQVLNRIN